MQKRLEGRGFSLVDGVLQYRVHTDTVKTLFPQYLHAADHLHSKVGNKGDSKKGAAKDIFAGSGEGAGAGSPIQISVRYYLIFWSVIDCTSLYTCICVRSAEAYVCRH